MSNKKEYREITLESVIAYLTEQSGGTLFDEDSNLIELFGDGDDTAYLVFDIEKDFNVDMSHFEYTKYFHNEHEFLSLYDLKGCFYPFYSWRKWREWKEIKKFESRELEVCTPRILYEYMIQHKRQDEDNKIDYTRITLESVIAYITMVLSGTPVEEDSNLIKLFGDGVNPTSLICDIEEDFKVDMSCFEYTKYFHYKHELQPLSEPKGCFYPFYSRRKRRDRKKEIQIEPRKLEVCTPRILYEYMIQHIKQ